MLFISILLLYLVALSVGLADTTIPSCKAPPSSCAFLPAFSTEICSDIISAQSKTLKTCFVPAETHTITITKPSVVKTTTVITATTTTETSTFTISETRTKRLPVIGALYTTSVISATYTTIVFTTVPKVQTNPKAVTITTTIPATKTARTTSTWAQQACDVPVDRRLRFKRDPLVDREALPLNCYCFLTASSTSATTATRTITTIPLTTTTVTKLTGGKAPTSTTTLWIKETTTTQTTVAATTSITTTITKTSRSRVTETWQKTKFSTTTTTSWYTKTATVQTIPVSTVQVNPCGPTSYGRVEIDLPDSQELMISNEVTLSGSTNNDRDCCNACYNTLGCVYWAKNLSDGTCLNFKAINSAGCSTPQCPNGFPQFTISGQDDEYKYFAGPCGMIYTVIVHSASTAEFKIKDDRKNALDSMVSDDHWFVVRERIEAEGHDRESYEHFYNYRQATHDVINNQNMSMKERRMLRALSLLIKLEGPLNSVKSIIQAAGLSFDASTEVIPATDFFGEPCSFYRINMMDRVAIEEWLDKHPQPDLFSPTYVRDSARKDLSSTSFYPTLGLDTTLPQFRPESDKAYRLTPRPSQNEYPVWYFFYGTLLDKPVLARLFGSNFHAPYRKASIRGGILKAMGKYNALVDDESGTNVVHGKAMRVQTREHEERLRAYETNVYEVGPNEFINGLTFRFIADFLD